MESNHAPPRYQRGVFTNLLVRQSTPSGTRTQIHVRLKVGCTANCAKGACCTQGGARTHIALRRQIKSLLDYPIVQLVQVLRAPPGSRTQKPRSLKPVHIPILVEGQGGTGSDASGVLSPALSSLQGGPAVTVVNDPQRHVSHVDPRCTRVRLQCRFLSPMIDNPVMVRARRNPAGRVEACSPQAEAEGLEPPNGFQSPAVFKTVSSRQPDYFQVSRFIQVRESFGTRVSRTHSFPQVTSTGVGGTCLLLLP